MVYNEVLNEDSSNFVYHHGSFQDLQTFLDKKGNPYTLVKYEGPIENEDDEDENEDNDALQDKEDNDFNDEENTGDMEDDISDSNDDGQDNSQDGDGQDNSQTDNQNQDSSQNNQSQSDNQDKQSQNKNKKIPPDPNAIYVDAKSGLEYKWDVNKRMFIKVGSI